MGALLPFWFVGALLIGYFGRRYRFGFWGYFLISVFLTPLIGLLTLIAAIPTVDQRYPRR
jgi:hypothetical protein